MTRVLRLIRRQLQLNTLEFYVPVRDMEDVDSQLVDHGVLEYRKHFSQQSVCPECGEVADVLRTTENGEEATYVHCESCRYLGWQKIDAKDVDLLTFSYRTFLQYIGDATIKGEYVEAAARCIPAAGIETTDRNPGKKRSSGRKIDSRTYDKSGNKDWTQKDAAALLGISDRQLRSYKRNPPKDWPGWEDPLLLKKWKMANDDRSLMAQAMKKSIRYKEGITERHLKN